MIYITGDTHGEMSRFNSKLHMKLSNLKKDDFLIVAGDFGFIWDDPIDKRNEAITKWREWYLNR